MSAFLLLLVKWNLATGMAIVLVFLLRRPLRALFGAPIAYAIWLAVPLAGIASLIPRHAAVLPAPRGVPMHAAIAPMPAADAPVSVMGQVAHSALRVTERLAGQVAQTSSPLMPLSLPPSHGMPGMGLLMFAAWAVGATLAALYLARLQARFHAAVRLGKAGPAVLGFIHPRIVTPDDFQLHFTPQEQAAILAHERIHLARQDARINALAALLQCLCWFNPLVHLGARWLRIDQELACDATAVSGPVSRRDYAEALLKSQMMVASLPLGCNWPGSQHPLMERIALLKRRPPGIARRVAGASAIVIATSLVSLGAWAAQPAVSASPLTAARRAMTLASLPSMVVMPDKPGEDTARPAEGNPEFAVPNMPQSRMVRLGSRIQTAIAALRQSTPVAELLSIADLPSPSANAATAPASQIQKPERLADSASSESVTVQSERVKAWDYSAGFVKSLLQPSYFLEDEFATWKHPVCPRVHGMSPASAHFIVQRIRDIAGKIGAPFDQNQACAPNVEIIVSPRPQAVVDDLKKERPNLFAASLLRDRQMRHPVQVWYYSLDRDYNGQYWADAPIYPFLDISNPKSFPAMAANNTQLLTGVQPEMNVAVIVADSAAIRGVTLGTLADYLTLLSLMQAQVTGQCQPAPSIANLFLTSCESGFQTTGLSDEDLALLTGLYQIPEGAERLQKVRIINRMRKGLEAAQRN